MNTKSKFDSKRFSIFISIYILLFITAENILQTRYPYTLYCIPPFLILPLMFNKPNLFKQLWFSWLLCGGVVLYYLLLNIYLAPGHPWVVYIAYSILWYPFSLYYGKKPFAFSVFGFLWCILFFTSVNIINSPNVIWAIYPIFAAAWWPLTCYFFIYKK